MPLLPAAEKRWQLLCGSRQIMTQPLIEGWVGGDKQCVAGYQQGRQVLNHSDTDKNRQCRHEEEPACSAAIEQQPLSP